MPMRQARKKGLKIKPYFFIPLMILLFCFSIYRDNWLYQYFFRRPVNLTEVVLQKMETAAKFQVFGLTIEENGPGYGIRFAGQVGDERLYGIIDYFDLEVYAFRDKYYVRGENIPEWQEITSELDALPLLVQNPFSLLLALLSDGEFIAEEGSERLLGNISCRTYYLEIPPPDILRLIRFEEDAVLEKLEIYLWFGQNDGFLYRVAFLMSISVKGENLQIKRIYDMTPDSVPMPDDVPMAEEGLITI